MQICQWVERPWWWNYCCTEVKRRNSWYWATKLVMLGKWFKSWGFGVFCLRYEHHNFWDHRVFLEEDTFGVCFLFEESGLNTKLEQGWFTCHSLIELFWGDPRTIMSFSMCRYLRYLRIFPGKLRYIQISYYDLKNPRHQSLYSLKFSPGSLGPQACDTWNSDILWSFVCTALLPAVRDI